MKYPKNKKRKNTKSQRETKQNQMEDYDET